jgi:hypothetical protein
MEHARQADSEVSSITRTFAGVPVSDFDAGIDLYTRFSGRPRGRCVGDKVLWRIDEHAWLFIEPKAAQAGPAEARSPSPASTRSWSGSPPSASITNRSRPNSNSVRQVKIPNPDGNAIASAEPSDAS